MPVRACPQLFPAEQTITAAQTVAAVQSSGLFTAWLLNAGCLAASPKA